MTALLENATATGSEVTWEGGAGLLIVRATTWNGATFTLQYEDEAGTFVTVLTRTADAVVPFALPRGGLKGVISGGPPTGVYAYIPAVPGGAVAGSMPGSGAVGDASAANQATEITALQAIQTAVEILDNIVSGNEAQVDVVTVPTDPFGANADAASAVGSISAKLRAIAVAVEILDNIVSGSEAQVDIVAALPAGDNNIGNVDVVTLPSQIAGPGAPVIDSYQSVAVNLAANTADQVVVSSAASKQIWVYGLVGIANVAGSISIQDEDNVALSGIIPVGATGGIAINPSGNFAMPWLKLGTDKDLEIDTVTCEFDGILTYAIVSV